MQTTKIYSHKKASSDFDARRHFLPVATLSTEKRDRKVGYFYSRKYFQPTKTDALPTANSNPFIEGKNRQIPPFIASLAKARPQGANFFKERGQKVPTHCQKLSFGQPSQPSRITQPKTLHKLARFLEDQRKKEVEDSPVKKKPHSILLSQDLDGFAETLPQFCRNGKRALCTQLEKYLSYISEEGANENSPESESLKVLLQNEIIDLKKGTTRTPAKNTLKEKGVQTPEPRVSLETFLRALKQYAMILINSGNAEFNLETLKEILADYSVLPPEFDFELQKVIKIYIDVLQKQLFFDQVIAILDSEDVDVDRIFQESIGFTLHHLQKANDKNRPKASPAKKDLFNPCGTSDSKTKKAPESQSPPAFNIDLGRIVSKRCEKETPKGFHQEFMAKISEFSLSWRKECATQGKI